MKKLCNCKKIGKFHTYTHVKKSARENISLETQRTLIKHKKEALTNNKRSQQGNDDDQQGLDNIWSIDVQGNVTNKC